MDEIPIRTEQIKLDQFLKLAAAVLSGAEGKLRIQAGEVQVNAETETRRGRKLHPGDRVQIGQQTFLVARSPGQPGAEP